jgi:hypothetical protein
MSRRPAAVRPPDSPYRNTLEAAAYLMLQPSTLERYRIDGTGPRYRKHGDLVVYAVADLNKWSDARTRVSTSDVVEDRAATAAR